MLNVEYVEYVEYPSNLWIDFQSFHQSALTMKGEGGKQATIMESHILNCRGSRNEKILHITIYYRHALLVHV